MARAIAFKLSSEKMIFQFCKIYQRIIIINNKNNDKNH